MGPRDSLKKAMKQRLLSKTLAIQQYKVERKHHKLKAVSPLPLWVGTNLELTATDLGLLHYASPLYAGEMLHRIYWCLQCRRHRQNYLQRAERDESGTPSAFLLHLFILIPHRLAQAPTTSPHSPTPTSASPPAPVAVYTHAPSTKHASSPSLTSSLSKLR